MSKINIGGVVEDVITSEEFTLEKARKVLKDEIVAVIGYGVQGRGQALNMRDNGINVIVGEGDYNWNKAIEDGWVPGQDPLPAHGGGQTGHDHPVPPVRRRAEGHVARAETVPDEGQGPLFLPRLLHRLQGADRASSRPPISTSSSWPPRAPGEPSGDNFLAGSGINSSYAVFQDATGRALERTLAVGHRHRLGLPLPDDLREGGLQRSDGRARRPDGVPGRRHGGPVQRAAQAAATAPARPSTRPWRS